MATPPPVGRCCALLHSARGGRYSWSVLTRESSDDRQYRPTVRQRTAAMATAGQPWFLIALVIYTALISLCVCCGVAFKMCRRKKCSSIIVPEEDWHEQHNERQPQSLRPVNARGRSELEQLSPVTLLRISPIISEQQRPSRQPERQEQRTQLRGEAAAEEQLRPPWPGQQGPQWSLDLQRVGEQEEDQQDRTSAAVQLNGGDKDPPPPYQEEYLPPSYEEAVRQAEKRVEVFTVRSAGPRMATGWQNTLSTTNAQPASINNFWRTAPSALCSAWYRQLSYEHNWR